MKKVFNNSEVPHIWALQQQESGRNSQGNIYFEGATIYSYGKHFPIATIQGNDVLFTLRSYSNTTAKHIRKAHSAVSHKNIIECYEVPVKYYGNDKPLNKQSFTSTHEKNLNYWKGAISNLFGELGNKKNRDITGRVNGINSHISKLTAYCNYFGIKIKDKELKNFLKIASQPDFIDIARKATEKDIAAREKKMKLAVKAYDQYLGLWREFKDEAISELPDNIKSLCNYYRNNKESFTHLRLNTGENRLETSKGVQIPAEVAKRAYKALNGCMEGSCKDISVPVMNYTITETGKDYIKAGCHTIPKADVQYIANLLNW